MTSLLNQGIIMSKIKEIDGDLLDFPDGVNMLVHCANCFHTFGGGIALQIKGRYPEAYAADCETVRGDASKLGDFSVGVLEDGKSIINVYGQHGFGEDGSGISRRLNYEALYKGFEGIRKAILDSDSVDHAVVGLPARIGSDLAGGDWNVVKSMIFSVFEDVGINVRIVNYNK